jgi:TPR repeat protein
LKVDPNHARELFQFAASYFADPEAQYYLAKIYLAGKGAPKDAILRHAGSSCQPRKAVKKPSAIATAEHQQNQRMGCAV